MAGAGGAPRPHGSGRGVIGEGGAGPLPAAAQGGGRCPPR